MFFSTLPMIACQRNPIGWLGTPRPHPHLSTHRTGWRAVRHEMHEKKCEKNCLDLPMVIISWYNKHMGYILFTHISWFYAIPIDSTWDNKKQRWQVCIEEFILGCKKLRGQARSGEGVRGVCVFFPRDRVQGAMRFAKKCKVILRCRDL